MNVNEEIVRQNGNQSAAAMADYVGQGGGGGGGNSSMPIIVSKAESFVDRVDGYVIFDSILGDDLMYDLLSTEYESMSEAADAAKKLNDIIAEHGGAQIVTRYLTDLVSEGMYKIGAMAEPIIAFDDTANAIPVEYDGVYMVDVRGEGYDIIKHTFLEQSYYAPEIYVVDWWPLLKVKATLFMGEGTQLGELYGLTQEVLGGISGGLYAEKPEIEVHVDDVYSFNVTMSDAYVVSTGVALELHAIGFYNVDGTTKQITAVVNSMGTTVTVTPL